MDSQRQRDSVWVVRANDNPAMVSDGTVKPLEMSTIEGQDRSVQTGGELQDLRVWDSLVGPARFQGGQHVMAELAKFHDHVAVEVLVAVKSSHGYQSSSSFSSMARSISS